MQFFKELNLPSTPLKDGVIEELYHLKQHDTGPNGISPVNYQTVHYDIERFISQDLLDALSVVNMRPTYFVHFGATGTPRAKTLLHSDLYRIDDQWIPDSYAINWELTPGTTDFRWYDASMIAEVPPPTNANFKLADFNSYHYGSRFNRDASACVELAHLEMQRNTPYLLKTDTPHQIYYTCNVETRVNISMRFLTKNPLSWERALEVFAPLFK